MCSGGLSFRCSISCFLLVCWVRVCGLSRVGLWWISLVSVGSRLICWLVIWMFSFSLNYWWLLVFLILVYQVLMGVRLQVKLVWMLMNQFCWCRCGRLFCMKCSQVLLLGSLNILLVFFLSVLLCWVVGLKLRWWRVLWYFCLCVGCCLICCWVFCGLLLGCLEIVLLVQMKVSVVWCWEMFCMCLLCRLQLLCMWLLRVSCVYGWVGLMVRLSWVFGVEGEVIWYVFW